MRKNHLSIKWKSFLPDILIFCLAAVLLFSNLESSFLWQDEAETALLGKNILQFGIPKAYDGINLVSQEVGREYGPGYIWRWTSWGDKYVAAISIWLFGSTTIGARFLFVVIGFLTVFFFHATSKRIFLSPWSARFATLFYVTSLPFLLHVRQCRYYSLVLFCSVLMLYFLVRPERKAGHWIGFAAASFCLFHSNYFLSLAILCSFLSAVFIVRLARSFEIREYLLGIMGAAAVSLPGMLLYRSYGLSVDLNLQDFLDNLGYYLFRINDYLYPFILGFITLIFYLIYRKRKPAAPVLIGIQQGPLLLNWGFIYIVIYLFVLSLFPYSFFRYMVPLFPVMALLMTLSIAFIARGRKGIMLLFAGILIFTNLLSVLPRYAVEWDPERAAVRSYLLEYIHELTHETRGPIRGIVEYLRENSEAGDVVLATFGDLPIKFYTGLEVHGGMSGEDLNTLDLERVRWLVVRYHSISKQPKKDLYVHEFIRSSFRVNDFIKITLDVPDAMFENREDPELHAFRTPEGEPKVILYRRKK